MVTVRNEEPQDIPHIRNVHRKAFPGPGEAKLVDLLRDAGKATISLVAVQDRKVVGHILFSPVTIEPEPDKCRCLGLAPIGILPEYQGQGVGAALIQEGLERCRQLGYDLVVVLGDPAYYSRFGFQTARPFGLLNEYGVDEPFMVVELRPGALADIHGLVMYQPEFQIVG